MQPMEVPDLRHLPCLPCGSRVGEQGCGILKKKVRPVQWAITMEAELGGGLFWSRPAHNAEALKSYCMKDDTRTRGPFMDETAYRGQDLPSPAQMMERPFQRSILEAIKGVADTRTVNWVCDTTGCCGKSTLVKYGLHHKLAFPLQWDTASNLLYQVSHNPYKAYFVDVTRAKPQVLAASDVYAAIEQVKNGLISSGKYIPTTKCQMPAHVWCFSNSMPDFKFLSADRWKVWAITQDWKLTPVRPPALKKWQRSSSVPVPSAAPAPSLSAAASSSASSSLSSSQGRSLKAEDVKEVIDLTQDKSLWDLLDDDDFAISSDMEAGHDYADLESAVDRAGSRKRSSK